MIEADLNFPGQQQHVEVNALRYPHAAYPNGKVVVGTILFMQIPATRQSLWQCQPAGSASSSLPIQFVTLVKNCKYVSQELSVRHSISAEALLMGLRLLGDLE
jgi:hypothetical protein